MNLTSTAALDAVNDMIGAIGEAPVNTIENSENVDVINAIRVLERVNREVQSKGWPFNHIEFTKLNPDVYTKKIRWQSDFLYLVGTDGTKYVQKNEYIYDLDNQTDTFTDAIEVECIRLVDFELLPFHARAYISARAARIFQNRTLGDAEIENELRTQEAEAWAALQEYELELYDWTVFDLQNVQELTSR